ncbi:hypothetical protein MHH37_15550 [Solibacillus sp. FSL K6-1781]|uniref:hypothetical protein n=1 Tax=Solibacillus sp. FSL K6-1781 TaxID=2921474 RepID=UPI00315A35BE
MHKELMALSNDIHRYIVLELFLKTLERDRDHVSKLKMKDVFDAWYESKINETFQEFKKLRDSLYKKGCKIEKQKSDEMMTYYFILFRGYDETRSYSNIALRNWVSEEMKRVLGMKYLTPADRK